MRVEKFTNHQLDIPADPIRGWRGWGIFSVLLLASGPAFAENPVPARWPQDRYQALAARSPFALALATAPAPAAETTGSFAANWFVSGLGQLNGENFVSIRARDLTVQFSLYGNETRHGVSLASVTWSDAVGKSTVVLRKGNETAKLEFNEAEWRSSPAGTAKGGLPKTSPGMAASGREPTAMGNVAPPGAGSSRETTVGRRQVPPQVARWMAKSASGGSNNGGASSPTGFAAVNADGFTTVGQTLADSPGFSDTPPPGSGPAGMQKLSAPRTETAGSGIDFQPPGGNTRTSTPGTLQAGDSRTRIPSQVAQWLLPATQNAIVQRKTDLID